MKPCPNPKCKREHCALAVIVDSKKHAVYCQSCFLRGPTAPSDAEAKDAWDALPRDEPLPRPVACRECESMYFVSVCENYTPDGDSRWSVGCDDCDLLRTGPTRAAALEAWAEANRAKPTPDECLFIIEEFAGLYPSPRAEEAKMAAGILHDLAMGKEKAK